MLNIKNKGGFTLVELMIVVSIIGVLAITLLPQLQGAQARARDGGRIASLQNISAVLETYLGDMGLYPASDGLSTGDSPSGVAHCLSDTSGTLANVSLQKIFKGGKAPVNPQKTSLSGLCTTPGSYQYTALTKDGIEKSGYILVADVETPQKANMNLLIACNGSPCDTSNLKADGKTKYEEITLTGTLTAEITGAGGAKNSVYGLKN